MRVAEQIRRRPTFTVFALIIWTTHAVLARGRQEHRTQDQVQGMVQFEAGEKKGARAYPDAQESEVRVASEVYSFLTTPSILRGM